MPAKKSGGTTYRYIGRSATTLESGQPIGPGEYVTLTDEDMVGQNQMYLDDGSFIDATGVDLGATSNEPAPQATEEGSAP